MWNFKLSVRQFYSLDLKKSWASIDRTKKIKIIGKIAIIDLQAFYN